MTSITSGNNRFHFRAECQADVNKLRQLLGEKVEKIATTFATAYPDVEVEIDTSLSLNDLKATMRQIVDGHAMVETVTQGDEYTGERRSGDI
jgi:hypothetical protein